MKWHDLLGIVGGAPFFESSMLLAGPDSPAEVRRQISRWVAAGRLVQIRRGLYALRPPFSRDSPMVFAVAAILRRPSYVSLESALAYHGAIPESVPVVTSVMTGRPGRVETPLGTFIYRHLHRNLFWGYRAIELGPGQRTYVAFPEKALLDLFHLFAGSIRRSFVRELRLSHGRVDTDRLQQFARRTAKPKLIEAAALTADFLRQERRGEVTL